MSFIDSVSTIAEAVLKSGGEKEPEEHAQCNDWLGREFDPILNRFVLDVIGVVRSSLHLPATIHVESMPMRLMRAILGHLLAAKADFEEVEFDCTVREFIFNTKMPVPAGLFVFYWIHPYSTQVVLRDIAMPQRRGDFSDVMLCQLLKFFPIAFMVSTAPAYEGLLDLTSYRSAAMDDCVPVTIRMDQVRAQDWPEAPTRDNYVFGGQSLQSSLISRPRPPKGR